jgi:hypothetical protein
MIPYFSVLFRLHPMIQFRLKSLVSSLIVVALLSLMAGCACFPCMDTSPYTQLATIAPPDPKIEDKGVPADPSTSIWRPGYWAYSYDDFYWVSGEWIDRPSPTAVWSPDHWIRHNYGWAFVPGYWL